MAAQGSKRPAVAASLGAVVVLGGDPAWPVAQLLRAAGVAVIDAEPPPKQIVPELAQRYGFLAGSVRAGAAFGDPRLAAQQLRLALAGALPEPLVWTDADGFARDAIRAAIEPGADSLGEVVANHRAHLAALRQAVERADLVILPLAAAALVAGPEGMLFPAPLPGMKPPKGYRTKAAPPRPAALESALDGLLEQLRTARPGLRVQLICPADGPQSADLRALAARCAAERADVLFHPLLDEALARLAATVRDAIPAEGGADPALGALVARLLGADDVIAALAEALAAPAPLAEAGDKRRRKTPQERAERRARRKANRRRNKQEGQETPAAAEDGGDAAPDAGARARVICEDELLEAFS